MVRGCAGSAQHRSNLGNTCLTIKVMTAPRGNMNHDTVDHERSGVDLPCLADQDRELGIDFLCEVCLPWTIGSMLIGNR